MSDPTPRRGEERPQREDGGEDRRDEPNAEGGSSRSSDVSTPFSPHKDDNSPLGDTDQHSDA